MSLTDLNLEFTEDSHVEDEEDRGLCHELVEVNNDVEEPKIGMIFETVKEAYNFYNIYARKLGFSVRIQRTNNSKVGQKIILRQLLVCSRQGVYQKINTPQKKRDERRCNCKAIFEIKRVTGDKYEVIEFKSEHSHELVPIELSRQLRSQREITSPQGEIMKKMHSSGLKQGQIFSYMCEEAGGVQNLNFTRSDCNNYLQKTQADFLKKGDAVCLLEYFEQKKSENKHFFYSFKTHEDGEICGVFFCDAKSRRDYGLFGDAICFDTTFRTNKYDMVCAPIVGVNHHGQTSLFGCGLLDGETYDGIMWLFTTFFEAMGGKKPKSIFTDQSIAISSVVDELLPEVHHGLCLWHLCQNAAKNMSNNGYKTFSRQFKSCIYDPETIEEFEESWDKLLDENNLRDNEWLRKTYALRKKWAQVYSHDHFCAGMTTSQRSESINKFLKDYFTHGRIVLREFVQMYSKAMDSRREKERKAEHLTSQTTPNMISNWSIEHEASTKYTRKVFNLFQEEIKKFIDLALDLEFDDGTICTYKVRENEGRRRIHTVTYNRSEDVVSCTCRKFEFEGIICSHALRVFRHLEQKSLPSRYYLKRWMKASTYEDICDPRGEIIPNDNDPLLTCRYSELSHISQRIVSLGSRHVDVSDICKSLLLEVETKIAACYEVDENNRIPTGICDKSISNLQKDCRLRDPKKRRPKGQPSKRIKSALETQSRKKTSKTSTGGTLETSYAMESRAREITQQACTDKNLPGQSGIQQWEFFGL